MTPWTLHESRSRDPAGGRQPGRRGDHARALRESALPVELIVVRDGQEAVDYLLRQGSHAAAARLAAART